MGDPNASIPTPQPVHYRPMFAAFGRALASSCVTFVVEGGDRRTDVAREARPAAPACCRSEDTARSARSRWSSTTPTPKIEVDPETYEVRADGELLTCEPATVLPMAQRYFLF